MKKIVLVSAGVASLLAVFLPATPAQAIPRTFVSSAGSGTACTRAAPCLTFQLAHNATDAGGEVNCLDASEFGAVTITKSITIDCTGTLGSISGNGVNINTAGVIVRLRNLTIDGLGVDGFGVSFSNGAALFVENCIVANYIGDNSSGIAFFPPDGVTAKLFVSDSVISNSGVAGILINASGSGSARVVIDRVRAEKNLNGFLTLSAGVTILHIRSSVSTGNALDGISVATNQNINSVTVDRTSLILNGANGVAAVAAFGSNAFVLLGRSTVISNGRGLASRRGGNIFSYQNNHLTGNVTDGAPTAVLSVK